jgi:NADH-quinone oxidoreductase subunit A
MSFLLAQADHYVALGILVVMAILFGAANVIASAVLGPGRQGGVKGIAYESGMNPIGTARKRFNVRFYVVAMTFLVFDVEIVFLYPWSTVFPNLSAGDPLGLQFLVRMMFFIGTSIVAYIYAWRKGVFNYD